MSGTDGRGRTGGILSLLGSEPNSFTHYLFTAVLEFNYRRALRTFRRMTSGLSVELLISLNGTTRVCFSRGSVHSVRAVAKLEGAVRRGGLLSLCSERRHRRVISTMCNVCGRTVLEHFGSVSARDGAVCVTPRLFSVPVDMNSHSSAVRSADYTLVNAEFPIRNSTIELFLR